MKEIIIKTSDFLNKMCKVLVTVMLMASFLMIFYQVFSRYVLQQQFMSALFPQIDFLALSFAWLEEVTRLLFVWCMFLAICIITLKMGHAKVELVVDRLPVKVQKIIFYIVDAVNFLFFGFVLMQSVFLVMTTKGQRSALLQFDMDYMYYSIIVGSAICIIHLIRLFVEGLKEKDEIGTIAEGGN